MKNNSCSRGRPRLLLICGALALLAFVLTVPAQYSINWHKVSGGGATSTGTNGGVVYSVSSTIGQHDASGTIGNCYYALTGGYWSLIALVQTAGAPMLSITGSGASVTVSWPAPSSCYFLQTNGNLDTANWVNYTGPIVLNGAGTTNSATLTPPIGDLFFRLGP